jgi:hypothetical protein
MSKMLAMMVPNPGGRLRLEERGLPEPGFLSKKLRLLTNA